LAVEGAVGSVVIVGAKPGRQRRGALGRGAMDRPVGPALGERLDEALGLAVGAGPVGAGARVADPELGTGGPVGARAVGGAVVGEEALHADALGGEEGDGAAQEGAGRLGP